MRAMLTTKGMLVHPSLAVLIDAKEEALIKFKEELGSFKPK
jgi:hypothetical protein